MFAAAGLRELLRDRLSAALEQVLTRVLLELDRALEDFEADSWRPEEPPVKRRTVYSAGVQFPEPQVKQEPQENAFVSELRLPESPQVGQESTDRGRSLSVSAAVDDFNEIQIDFVTSLNSGLSTCRNLSSNLGLKPEKRTVEEEQHSNLRQSDSSASCRSPGAADPPPLKQEPTDRGRSPSDPGKVESKHLQGPNHNTDTEEKQQSDSRGRQMLPETDQMQTDPQEPSVYDQNAFTLKVPVIKLHPLFQKNDPKEEKMASKSNKRGSKGGGPVQRGVKYMCLCGSLFSKESLEIHQTPLDGESRPFGCPFSDAFNVKGSGQEVQEPEGSLQTTQRFPRVSEWKGSGDMTTGDFQNKTSQRDESCGEDGNLRYFRQTFLNNPKAANPSESEVCEEEEAGSHGKTQISAPLGDPGKAGEAGSPFSCDVCGRGFSWLPRLYQHRKRHFVAGPFWCQNCGRTFRRILDLRAHLCIQTGQKPYSCSVCTETFFLRIQLHNHMSQHKRKNRP